MPPSASRQSEGLPSRCPVCGAELPTPASAATGDVPCPQCGSVAGSRLLTLHREFPFLLRAAAVPNLESTATTEVLKLLVGRLAEAGGIPAAHRDEVVAALLKREELGSTGIGRGIAVPHCRHSSVSKTVGVWGYSAAGVVHQSLDGQPVHNFFLLVSPVEQSGEHLRALEHLCRKIREWDWK